MAKLKTIGKTKILYVMATDAEFGENLQKCFEPLMCGVGPVEAALNTALALTEFSPNLIVSLGSAGSAVLEQTGIYQASSVAYRDMDASAFGFKKGETPFLGLPATIEVSNRVPSLP